MVDIQSLSNRPPRSFGTVSSRKDQAQGGPSQDPSSPSVAAANVEDKKEAVIADEGAKKSGTGEKKGFFSFWKILLIVILLLLLGGGFYWWQNRDRVVTADQTTITYWGLWEPESVMAGLIEEFEEKNPQIKVKYVQQNIVDYRQRLQSALASGSGPDIFRIHNTWLPMFKNDLAPVPADVASSLSLETNYYPVLRESFSSGGSFYGIPLMFDSLALFYNKDIFTQYQLSPPQDWDKFRQVANQLTIRDDEGRILQAGAAIGAASNVDHWSDILGLMILQNGAPVAGPYGTDAQQALDFFTIFTRQDRVWDETLPSSTQAFAGGKLALYFAPSWRIINLNELNPDLDFGVVPVPQLPEREPVAWATFWVEGVSVRSEKQAAAWQFLEFLSKEESLERIFKAGSQVHYIGQLYPRIDMADKLKQDPLLAPFLEQASYAKSWYLSSRTADSGINDNIIKYFEDAVNRSLMGANSELETTVTQGVASVLSRYQVSRP